MTRRAIYTAPWAEPLVRPSRVELVEYGPTARTLLAQVARHRDWAWRPPSRRPHAAGRDVLRAFMRLEGGELRDDVPEREREVYVAVHEQGHSTRWAARALGVSRASVQTYLRRLRARAVRWRQAAEAPPPERAIEYHLRVLGERVREAGRGWLALRVEVAA